MKHAFLQWYNDMLDRFTIFHISKKHRKIFSLMYSAWLLLLLLFFAISGLLFYLFGVEWTDNGFDVNGVFSIDQILELVFGIIIFVLTLTMTVISNFSIIDWFKKSKIKYQATESFESQKKRVENLDLTLQSNKQLKWFYKLGYITKEKLTDQKEYNLNLKKALRQKTKTNRSE